jgi:hypothetical protein
MVENQQNTMKSSFPHSTQLDAMDCGATCLRMIAKYYGQSYSNQFLREKSFITRSGVSLLGISEAAESIGGCTVGAKMSLKHPIGTCVILFSATVAEKQSRCLCRAGVFQFFGKFIDYEYPNTE